MLLLIILLLVVLVTSSYIFYEMIMYIGLEINRRNAHIARHIEFGDELLNIIKGGQDV